MYSTFHLIAKRNKEVRKTISAVCLASSENFWLGEMMAQPIQISSFA